MTIKKILIAVVLLALVFVAFNYQKIKNLRAVITMFNQDKIVHNFSHMRDSMFSIDIERGTKAKPLPSALEAFPDINYLWRNQTKPVKAWLDETDTTSLLVLRDGVIVHEEYRLNTQPMDQRISWSMAKSFLSALFGIAVHEGLIKNLDDAVSDYVPELKESAYNNVPIRHVLNMASGVGFDEDYLAFNSDINKMGRVLGLGGSMDKFTKNMQDVARASGTNRHYVSIDTHVLGMVLRKVTNKPIKEYFEQKLWSYLNAEGDAYYLTDGHGVAFVLGGLNLTTRDYARFGELFRNKGVWNGKQIVPASWVAESTVNSAPPPLVKEDTFGYGYQWWIPENSEGEYFAGGIYGQFIYVNPKNKTVIVKTSADREFRNDGVSGRDVKHETVQMFRAITEHYTKD